LRLPAHTAGKLKLAAVELAAEMTVLSLYRRIWRTYFSWARSLLPLACFVFVPLGLVHAIPVHFDATEFHLGTGFALAGAMLAILLLSAAGLLGEIFYTGAVAIALTHPHGADGRPPSLLEVARMVRYRTLIAVDLLFGVLVAVGVVALVVPGVLLFVYLGLAAPVAEIERHGWRDAFARSFRLVRGNFWLVFAVLVPIELLSDALTSLATAGAHSLLGDSLIAEWLTDTASNILLTPFYAVAAVLLTVDLIAARDGATPQLHSAPVSR
jgi:hypothetical protein